MKIILLHELDLEMELMGKVEKLKLQYLTHIPKAELDSHNLRHSSGNTE